MFKDILETLIFILDSFSILVIVWGVVLAFISFLKLEITSKSRIETVDKISIVKNHLGTYILLGLEILIGADIIETILNPSFQDILILATIVIIRTVISYFLNKEIESNKN